MKIPNFLNNLLGVTQSRSVTKKVPPEFSMINRRELFRRLLFSTAGVSVAGFNNNVLAETSHNEEEEEFWRIKKFIWDRDLATRRKNQMSSVQKLIEPLGKMLAFSAQDLLDPQTNREVLAVYRSLRNTGLIANDLQKRMFAEAMDEAVNRIQSIQKSNKSEQIKRKWLSEYFQYGVYEHYVSALNEYRKFES